MQASKHASAQICVDAYVHSAPFLGMLGYKPMGEMRLQGPEWQAGRSCADVRAEGSSCRSTEYACCRFHSPQVISPAPC